MPNVIESIRYCEYVYLIDYETTYCIRLLLTYWSISKRKILQRKIIVAIYSFDENVIKAFIDVLKHIITVKPLSNI